MNKRRQKPPVWEISNFCTETSTNCSFVNSISGEGQEIGWVWWEGGLWGAEGEYGIRSYRRNIQGSKWAGKGEQSQKGMKEGIPSRRKDRKLNRKRKREQKARVQIQM